MRKSSLFGMSFLAAVAAISAGVSLLPHARVWPKMHSVVVSPEKEHVMRTYAGTQSGSQITYYGGAVMGVGTNVYVVYYGNWASSSQNIVNGWLQNIGGSSLYNINTTYFDNTGAEVQNAVNYNPTTNSYHDNYSLGANLTDANIQTVISNAINGGHFPTDDNGLYFVLTSPDVSETDGGSSFCGSYCGYHGPSTSIVSGHTIKYSFVGSPAACPSACDGNIVNGDGTTPNGDVGADGAINVMFHELSETVSDPVITAWGEDESESGDLCNFNFGTWGSLPVGSNGAHYNVSLSSGNYLIQQMFQVSGTPPAVSGRTYPGACSISLAVCTPDGGSCSSAGDCCDGSCVAGVCQICAGSGTSCSRDSDCCSGTCDPGSGNICF